ncbi:MAG: methyltransferase family protein [Halocynthiibacter sp.]
MKRYIDLPPVWLLGALIVAYVLRDFGPYLPLGPDFADGGHWGDLVGGIFVGGGVLLMLLAAMEMIQRKTTLDPHGESTTLVQSGIYKRSRNPIYVGDVLILLGLILFWNVALALPLVPLLVWILEKRFIIPEERKLRMKFKAVYAAYERKTRRWV